MVGITAFGGYVPRLRLQRQAIVDAHGWADPGLLGKAKGERADIQLPEGSVSYEVLEIEHAPHELLEDQGAEAGAEG